MNLILRQFKEKDGSVKYPAVFSVTQENRIPQLAAQDFTRINLLIVGALTMAFESMNLKRGMNEFQILDLSEAIIDSAEEDNLSLEDVMLFLQNLVRGKYEMSYESMDIPKFMRIFELYREERHQAMLDIRENEHYQCKGLGDANRSNQSDPLSEHFSRMADSMSQLKRELRETKHENNVIKQAEKYFKE